MSALPTLVLDGDIREEETSRLSLEKTLGKRKRTSL
jgi:hypothetical protein